MNHRFVCEAALLIRNDPRFKEFIEWVDAEQKVALQVLTGMQEDRKLYAAQGAYNALQKLKDLIESAPAQLDKLARGNSHS